MQLTESSDVETRAIEHDWRGQSLVEFALVLPLTLLIILAIVIFGMAFARMESVENAASEGGRAAQRWTTGGPETCIEAVDNAIARSTPFNTVNAVTGPCPDDTTTRISSGALITVQVSHAYVPVFFGTLFRGQWEPPAAFNLASEVTVRHE